MENRRQTPRFKLHQVIEMSCFKESFVNVSSVDISINGMQFITKEPIENEAKVFLMFEIPDGGEARLIKCEGVVLWQEKKGGVYQAGILFTSLLEDDKEKLQNYLDSGMKSSEE